jgi:pyruvate,orthophosphate dikinase
MTLVSSLDSYYDNKIFENDPFAKLDQDGVGKLMEMAVESWQKDPLMPDLHSVSAESTVVILHLLSSAIRYGLDYVSCSPFRVPIARLAAAQAAINEG